MLITPFGNVNRVRLATAWMNEEWYNDRIRRGSDSKWVCLPSAYLAFVREMDADRVCRGRRPF